MEEFNKFQKLKLKPIKLKELLFESKLKLEVNNNKVKKESKNIKSRNKQDNLYYNNPFLNTLNSTGLSKNNKTIINLKYKSPFNKNNKSGIKKILINIKPSIERKKISLDLDKGFTNYFKKNANKKYQKMKYLLFKERIKRLSLPKYRHINDFENDKAYNNMSSKNNYTDKNDNCNQILKNNRYKKYDNYLFEKEKLKVKKRINNILKYNFKKLDSCETRFNTVVDRTMKLLSEYQHIFEHLKKVE